ncbi:MAG: Tfp pilus assembly protein PilX [Lysobacterales bacterium]
MGFERELQLHSYHAGAVLLLCLLLLSSLTFLGLAAATGHVLQTRMSGNLVDGSVASQSADSAIKWGKGWLFGLNGTARPTACSSTCGALDVIRTEGFYGDDIEHQDLNWWEQTAFEFGKDPATGVLLNALAESESERSHWLIEEIHVEGAESEPGPATEIAYYRISARGSLGNSGIFTVTQSIVARPWGDETLSNSFPKPAEETGICFSLARDVPCGRLAWRRLQ